MAAEWKKKARKYEIEIWILLSTISLLSLADFDYAR